MFLGAESESSEDFCSILSHGRSKGKSKNKGKAFDKCIPKSKKKNEKTEAPKKPKTKRPIEKVFKHSHQFFKI